MADEGFPDWSEPATKGDIILAMLASRGLALGLHSFIVALKTNDDEKLREAMETFEKYWTQSVNTMDQLGGKRDGAE